MKELKTSARCALTGKYMTLIGAFLLSRIVIFIFGEIFAQNSANTMAAIITLAASILLLLLRGLMDAGLHTMHLKSARGEQVRSFDLFGWFRFYPDKVLVITLILIMINLLLAVPFLVIAWILIRQEYANALQVLFEVVTRPAIPLLSGSAMWFFLAAVLVWFTLMLCVNFLYMPVFFVLSDHPEETPLTIMAESRRIMQGQRLRLFGMILSFAGLALLGIVSVGIGLLWVIPYVRMTEAFFYLDALHQQNEE